MENWAFAILLWNLGFQEMRCNGMKTKPTKQLSMGCRFPERAHVLAAVGAPEASDTTAMLQEERDAVPKKQDGRPRVALRN